MLFPVLYWGRSRQGEDYLGLFPLYGDIREFLGRDRFLFFLFPLYGYHTVDDVETWEVLWPIVSRSRGEHVSRFRVWPFYGRSEKDEAYIKHFVLWPFWTHARFMYPAAQGTSWILFPFYGRTDMTDQQGWTVLPPFFRWSRSAQRRELSCPWPFVQYASGDEDKLYLWPLWGRREREGSRSGFAAWPFFHWRRLESGDRILERRFLLPFVYHERVLSPSETEATARYVKLWPLYDYRREGETMRLRLPTLWPLKQTGAIERNLAPLWTLFSHTRTGESVETELLWGLYRYRRDGAEERRVSLFPLMSTHRCGSGETERSGWSFLLGLLGREKEANESRWRFLWFF